MAKRSIETYERIPFPHIPLGTLYVVGIIWRRHKFGRDMAWHARIYSIVEYVKISRNTIMANKFQCNRSIFISSLLLLLLLLFSLCLYIFPITWLICISVFFLLLLGYRSLCVFCISATATLLLYYLLLQHLYSLNSGNFVYDTSSGTLTYLIFIGDKHIRLFNTLYPNGSKGSTTTRRIFDVELISVKCLNVCLIFQFDIATRFRSIRLLS